MSDRAWQRPVWIAAVAAATLVMTAGVAFSQSLAPPPLTNLPPVTTAPTITPSVGPTIPALRPPGPDVLPSVEREYRRLRDAPLPPSRCNYLDNGRTCAKLWVIGDWRSVTKHKRGKAKADRVRRAPPQIVAARGQRPAVAARDHVPGEVLIEFDGGLSEQQLRALARRHRLTRVSVDTVALVGTRIGLFRINDRRSPQTVARALAADGRIRAAQANFVYTLQSDAKPAAADNSMLYPHGRLRLAEAHALARGRGIVVAVIDSGVDIAHPELVGALAGSFDPLGSKEKPHQHGTGVAGAIVARAKLTGGAPEAKILAIRAFGEGKTGSQSSTSYLILKSLDIALGHGARIVNMSFAGSQDPLIARGVAAAAARGIVMIAAAGNAGPKSPPLYPAALPGVIAVSATSPGDTLFAASNRGPQIAVAAPGVDVLLPAPDGKYEVMTGTSFSAAFVSGIAALMIERNPTLVPDQVRAVLSQTARDLGAPGRDDLFGAGEADAFAALSRVDSLAAPLVAAPATAPQPSVATAQPATPGAALAAPAGAEQEVGPAPAAAIPAR
ncbi:Peptidase S8 and S53, subtilisin, kexin, sedolisin [Rhodopseudomonas palustris HaA2]|uniref:Peptidase S8 and S53, subtilisin, kexin, sedolisin n=1 Tax=Rhodopseudomonas palustris (strain HaA2) TaxID=316058 RepID=Q2IU68_RHOP2|nr:S8 family serine peptidase [Rhodopseudomonas palustris]ABD08242.1 Peptidase S8 and S53, subtilisin, kexin, sedolisin [Rhodopseudomonas palustris HaA2]